MALDRQHKDLCEVACRNGVPVYAEVVSEHAKQPVSEVAVYWECDM